MVKKLYGKADNITIIFEKKDGDNWTAVVPSDLSDGMYIVALYAEDEAGNTSFFSKILLLADTKNISIVFIKQPFFGLLIKDIIHSYIIYFNKSSLLDSPYITKIMTERYLIEIKEVFIMVENHKEYLLGEDKKVRLQVQGIEPDPFYIQQATYELSYGNYEGIEASGNCEINETLLTAQVAPKKRGTYYLTFTYIIGTETFKERISIRVI
jgi:hypothetical protein